MIRPDVATMKSAVTAQSPDDICPCQVTPAFRDQEYEVTPLQTLGNNTI